MLSGAARDFKYQSLCRQHAPQHFQNRLAVALRGWGRKSALRGWLRIKKSRQDGSTVATNAHEGKRDVNRSFLPPGGGRKLIAQVCCRHADAIILAMMLEGIDDNLAWATQTPVVTWRRGPDGQCFYSNGACLMFTGSTLGEVQGGPMGVTFALLTKAHLCKMPSVGSLALSSQQCKSRSR